MEHVIKSVGLTPSYMAAKLMITRLRKIFYDKGGWSTQLIRKAAGIEGRYDVDIVDDLEKNNLLVSEVKEVRRYKDNQARSKYRVVKYKANDRVYPDRAGDTPYIY